MSEHQETTKYDAPLTDVPPLAEDFSLEEILAEYGGSREQRIMEDVEQAVRETEPSPTPEEPPAPPPRRTAPKKPEPKPGPQEPPPPPEPQPEVIPESPRPISLEEVVGSTVDAVMEENAELLLKPRRGLFSRRKLEETEELYERPTPEPEPEIEPIGPELEPWEAAENYRENYRSRRGGLLPALLTAEN